MRRIIGIFLIMLAMSLVCAGPLRVARHYQIASPRSSMVLSIPIGSFSLEYEGVSLLQGSQMALCLSDGTRLTLAGRIVHTSHDENVSGDADRLSPELSFLAEGYNVFRMEYENGYGVEWRVADKGMAYRWYAVAGNSPAFPLGEEAEFSFSSDKIDYLFMAGKGEKTYLTSRKKHRSRRLQVKDNGHLSSLPVFVDCGSAIVTINESDLDAYPEMALTENEPYSLKAVFPTSSVGLFWQTTDAGDKGIVGPWRVVSLYTGEVRSIQK